MKVNVQRAAQRLIKRGTAARASALVAAVVIGTASARAGAPQTTVANAAAKMLHWFETGKASWYGRAAQGHRTASGETFDMNGMTCAHRTLPLGSWLRVTNLTNSRSVLVRVTDRGPVSTSRVVDLSYAAARAVGIGGVGRVRLEALNPSDPAIASTIAARVVESMMPSLNDPSRLP